MVSFLNSSYYLCSIDFADTVVSSLTSNVIMYRTFIIYFNGTRKAKLMKLSWWHHEMEKFPRNWQFVQGIHRFSMKSPHKGQWSGALMFSLICARINHWVNSHEAGDLRRYRCHHDVIVMYFMSKWLRHLIACCYFVRLIWFVIIFLTKKKTVTYMLIATHLGDDLMINIL